jgi:hypothetical protein
MLPTIGLACDLIGALTLARGLFRHAERLYPGFGRWPTTAAEDHAYGTVGGLFLAAGFTGQALPNLGVTWHGTPAEARTAAAIALAAGTLLALVAYGLLYAAFLRRELRRVNDGTHKDLAADWDPTWRRPWNHRVYEI